jgi:putative ABC transport system substrate-binding protein
MSLKLRHKLLYIFTLILISGPFWRAPKVESAEIAVIMSRRIVPFDLALEGFLDVVDRSYRVYDLAKTGREKIVKKILQDTAVRIILAIGRDALGFSQDEFPRLPIVFTMVTNPSRIVRNNQNVTGIRMETPWKVLFKYTKMIAPRNKKVGIILNQQRAKSEIEHIKNLAVQYKLEPILKVVDNASKAISEFKNIEDEIEAFLMVPDLYILTPKFYEYILLSSFHHKFALAGLSPKYTKTGSLFSVMGNNRDWGGQAGLIVNKILSGTTPQLIPYGFARKYSLSINLKTAARIGIDIKRSIKKQADSVIR